MNSVTSFSKAKTTGSGGNGQNFNSYTVHNIEYSTKADRLATARKIWGAPFDGSADVTGDFLLTGNHSMEVYGPWTAGSYYSSVSYTKWIPTTDSSGNSKFIWRRTDVDATNVEMHFHDEDNNLLDMLLSASGIVAKGDFLIKAKKITLESDSLEQKYDEGHIDLGKGWIKANSGYFNNLWSQNTGQIYIGDPVLLDGGLELNGDLTVKNLYSNNIYNQDEIRTKDLTVTGNAHFFNLVIDEVKHAGGQVILSPGALRIDLIGDDGSFIPTVNFGVAGESLVDQEYKTLSLYQVCSDEDQSTDNTVQPFDHVICYTANVNDEGEFDARSWWTLVTATGHAEVRIVNGEAKECNRIDIVTKVKAGGEWRDPSWGEVIVKEGDNCAVLGSHNRDRQSAICLSAYNTFDVDIVAPAIVQYVGIDGFTLHGKQWTYFAKNGNKVRGDFVIDSTGEDIADIIARDGGLYMHKAWSNSPDGSVDFVKDSDKPANSDFSYLGTCTNMHSDDDNLIFSDYFWTEYTNRIDRLIPTRERLYLGSDDTVWLDVEYLVDYITQPDWQIYVDIYTYAGATTRRQVNRESAVNSTVYYTGKIQENWSQVLQYSARYSSAVVYLVDSGGNVMDTHAIQLTWDAGAVLSVTDTIKARVADDEGNIATLVMTARALIARIQSAESQLEFILTDKSLELKIDALDGRLMSLTATVDGIITKISAVQGDDLVLQNKMNQLEITVDGLTEKVENIETIGYDDTEIRRRIAELSITVDGLSFDVGDKIMGGLNLLNATDFGIDTNAQYLLNWNQTGTLTSQASGGPVSEHGYIDAGTNGAISQVVTGKLLPAQWYTLSLYTTDPTKVSISFSIQVANSTYYYYYCSEESASTAPANMAIQLTTSAKSLEALNNFKRYWITFKTSDTLSPSSPVSLTFGLTAGARIALVKLEDGQYCTPWDYSPKDREAKMLISPDEIYFRLIDNLETEFNETGIDIVHKKITLKSENTDIIGNLNIREANESGVTIFDENDRAVINIQPWEIDTFSNFQTTAFTNYSSTLIRPTSDPWYFFHESQLIGSVESGQQISLQNFSVQTLTYNPDSDSQSNQSYASSLQCTLQIRWSATRDSGQSVVYYTNITMTKDGTNQALWTSN